MAKDSLVCWNSEVRCCGEEVVKDHANFKLCWNRFGKLLSRERGKSKAWDVRSVLACIDLMSREKEACLRSQAWTRWDA
jgi:hypothetical protein